MFICFFKSTSALEGAKEARLSRGRSWNETQLKQQPRSMPQKSLKTEIILQRRPTLRNISHKYQSLVMAAPGNWRIDFGKAASLSRGQFPELNATELSAANTPGIWNHGALTTKGNLGVIQMQSPQSTPYHSVSLASDSTFSPQGSNSSRIILGLLSWESFKRKFSGISCSFSPLLPSPFPFPRPCPYSYSPDCMWYLSSLSPINPIY